MFYKLYFTFILCLNSIIALSTKVTFGLNHTTYSFMTQSIQYININLLNKVNTNVYPQNVCGCLTKRGIAPYVQRI